MRLVVGTVWGVVCDVQREAEVQARSTWRCRDCCGSAGSVVLGRGWVHEQLAGKEDVALVQVGKKILHNVGCTCLNYSIDTLHRLSLGPPALQRCKRPQHAQLVLPHKENHH